MMTQIKAILISVLSLLLFTSIVQAMTLREAMDETAKYFVKEATKIDFNQELHILEIINQYSLVNDETGKEIESELYLALEKQTPDFKLLQGSSKDRGKEINLLGTYEQKGETTTIKLRIIKGQEILAQYEVDFETGKIFRKTLVGVLDIESENLDKTQKKAFSDIFRSYLSEYDKFDLASNAELDKMDADMIQQSTGCTRDTCATIIGEQLGMDRVISTSIFQVSENMFVISARMMDIQSGSLLVSRTVDHRGDLGDIKSTLRKLAGFLTRSSEDLEAVDVESGEAVQTLKAAAEEAAAYFVKEAVKIGENRNLHVLEVVNLKSQQNDMVGKQIETDMFFALEQQMPDFRLFLGEGKGLENEIYLSGTYSPKAGVITANFKIYKDEEILAQYEVEYSAKTMSKALVAVLDLEADMLNPSQRKAFSDIFRAVLNEIDVFDMASSADIDKLDPDAIQKETGCTRDSCATVIGEQLGVDRVISTTLSQVSEDDFVLSAKLIDIKDGSILISKVVEYDGDISTLRAAIEDIAFNLTGNTGRLTAYEEDSNMIWHITGLTLLAGSLWKSADEASRYNQLADDNSALEKQYQEEIVLSERTKLMEEYEDNKTQMAQHKSNASLYDAISVLMVCWEAYLFFFSSDASGLAVSDNHPRYWPDAITYQPVQNSNEPSTMLSLSWNW
jgi:hypothetical protein